MASTHSEPGSHEHPHGHDASHAAEAGTGNCEEALHELYTFLDGELTETKRSDIRAHLDDCSPCLEAYDFEAELRLVIKHRCQEQVPDALRQRVAEQLAALDADPAAGSPEP